MLTVSWSTSITGGQPCCAERGHHYVKLKCKVAVSRHLTTSHRMSSGCSTWNFYSAMAPMPGDVTTSPWRGMFAGKQQCRLFCFYDTCPVSQWQLHTSRGMAVLPSVLVESNRISQCPACLFYDIGSRTLRQHSGVRLICQQFLAGLKSI